MDEITAYLPGLSPVENKELCVRFDGGRLSSDGGVLVLREIEKRLGLAARLAGCLSDARDPASTTHSYADMIGARMFAIACGYEDCDDLDVLRFDPDSRLMRKSKQHEYRQAYNAQAVVDAGGSQLIVGARVTNCASDRNELVADIAAIPAVLGRPATVLADNGYANGDEVAALAESGIEALVSTAAEGRRRRHDFRPAKAEAPVKEPKAEWLQVMTAKLASEDGRALYRLRQQTVEPVYGIIKAVLGFTGFSLRGLDKVAGEWDLVALAYNCKRLHKLKLEMAV